MINITKPVMKKENGAPFMTACSLCNLSAKSSILVKVHLGTMEEALNREIHV
jgi:hypothetical protein